MCIYIMQESIIGEIRALRIQSVAIPPLGSGLGGLDWTDVRPKIEAAMRPLSNDTRIIVFEPMEDTLEGSYSTKVPNMTPGRAALVGLIQQYLSALLDPFVTLLEVHKLMYFMQEAGEPLKLKYTKAPYGPYAENLRHVLRTIEGHLLSGYSDGGDNPTKRLELVPGATSDAHAFLEGKSKTQARFNRVADLVQGFETPLGLELLSTVHWVIAKESAKTRGNVVAHTYAWSERKRRFSEHQICLAVDVLGNKGWISKPLTRN
jgi:O-acetyl-ADP-ribose deacetylase (regulator of RNase III)